MCIAQLIGVCVHAAVWCQKHLIKNIFATLLCGVLLSESANISESSLRNPAPMFPPPLCGVASPWQFSRQHTFSIFGTFPLFFAFITAAHRHALWVNCHLCFAYGAMKRKQWWKQTTITVAWILYCSKALCTEARKRMFHPRSSFDWTVVRRESSTLEGWFNINSTGGA